LRLALTSALGRHHVIALDLDRPRPQAAAGARPGDAHAAADAEERAVRAADDQVALAGQVAVGERGQRQAGVRAAVDIAEEPALLAHEEAEEEVVALAEHE